jgi:hypothetical protein
MHLHHHLRVDAFRKQDAGRVEERLGADAQIPTVQPAGELAGASGSDD